MSDGGPQTSGEYEASRETGAAVAEVLGASGEPAKQGETLRGEVNLFLASIRAA